VDSGSKTGDAPAVKPAATGSLDAGELAGCTEAQRRLLLLARVAELLSTPLAVGDRLARLARIVVPDLADWCVVELAERGKLQLALVHDEGAGLARLVSRLHARDGVLCPGSMRALQSGRPELYGEAGCVGAQKQDEEALRELPARSGIALPLRARGRTLGVLTLARSSGSAYGPTELALAQEIARPVAVALDDAWLHEAEHRARVAAEEVVESTALLYSFTAGLAQALTPRDVAQVVTSLGCDVVGAQGAWVSALSRSGEEVELLAASGFSAGFVAAQRRIDRDLAFGAQAIGDATARWLGSPAECAAAGPGIEEAAQASGGQALALVPMLSLGVPTGLAAFTFAEPRRFDDAKRSQVTALVRQATEALERARLYELERASRAEAERSARQRAALQALTAALSRAVTVNDVARILVEEGKGALGAAAGWVSVLAEDGATLELRAQSGYQASFVDAYRRFPLAADMAVAHAVRDGSSRWFESVRTAETQHPELAAGEAATGAEALAVVPLSARGSAFGFLALRFPEAREFPDAERAFLTTLASQAAQAIERARLYEAEHTVAQTLQRSLLPEALPSLDGALAAVRYLAAAEHAEAGGDWYDVLQLPDGRIGLSVGDVVGHGVAAAAVMGQLRSALRAYALTRAGPAKVLRRLSTYAADVAGALAATAAYVVIDPGTGLARFARAGHPPPLLLSGGGPPRYLDGPGGSGTPLACEGLERLRDGHVVLQPGDLLLLYSDGAVERRGESIERGLERLAAAAAEVATADPALLCDAVLGRLFESSPPRDDVVLLALCLAPVRPGEPLRLRLPAKPEALAEVRHALRPWLAEAGADANTIEAVTLACHEACTNAVEHAYRNTGPGLIEVELTRGSDALELIVVDHGRWRSPGGEADERGRGLALMRGLMDEVDLRPGPGGTVVHMRTQLAPGA
jgi:GAF domain-containing protein/anti-sigma regulatory factor (Ser/Thr protein kinase)